MAPRREVTGSDATFNPSAEQRAVIEALPDTRLLVGAGPGTGKTAVACARIAWLVNTQDVEPTDVWLVSFTRTAVHELRNRIGAYVGDPRRAAGVRIATIDSHAWAIHSGFQQDATLTGSFEDNIERVVKLIQSHEGVFEYLASVRHLVIDEAQDIVGTRCELCLELINALPQDSGVTVFSDEAQAIYGFAEDDSIGEVEGTLPEVIRDHLDNFDECELTEIHRTSDRVLNAVFRGGREILRSKQTGGAAKLTRLRELIGLTNHGTIENHRTDLQNTHDRPDTFLLFRRRGEALEASGYLNCQPHRLRLSGLPHVIHDWIGHVFWDWTASEIDKTEFERRWKDRLPNRTELTLDAAWRALVRIVGPTETRVSVAQLRQRLAAGSPPVELCNPDFGPGGPVVGTIHGAKGREAGEVRVYLPPPIDDQEDEIQAEEARVVFVAATRAKQRLMVGQGATRALARRLEPSGRAYTPYPYGTDGMKARACVEIGRDRDIDAASVVGKKFFSDAKSARKAQDHVMKLAGTITKATATAAPPSMEYRYAVATEAQVDQPLCYLTKGLNYDLFEIAKVLDKMVHLNRKKPPARFKHIRLFGVGTLVFGPDDPVRETLHAPWRDSGFVFAPLVIGYDMAWFRY